MRTPRPGDAPAGADWQDGRCDEVIRDRARIRDTDEADERTHPAPLAYLSPVVEEVARLRVENEQVTAHRDHLSAMIRRLSDFLDSRGINSWKHGACWAAEDAIKSLTARAEAAEAERDRLAARVAAVKALAYEWQDAQERGVNGRHGYHCAKYGNHYADDLRAALATGEGK